MSKGALEQGECVKQIGEKAREKKRSVYVCFIDLKKAYDRVNMEALRQMLRMYYVRGGKLLNGIKRKYVDCFSLCQSKRGESEQFRIDSGVR